MATNTPSASNVEISPVVTLRSLTPVTFLGSSVPTTSSSTEFHTTSTLGFLNRRSCMILSARKLSRRCTTTTFSAKLVRNSASSTAVLPPPTTTTRLPLKKKPSQVAQAETPYPLSFSSLARPSHLACA